MPRTSWSDRQPRCRTRYLLLFVWRLCNVLEDCQAHGTSRNIPPMATLGLRCFARRDNKPTAKPRCTRKISSRSVDHELYGKDKDSCTLDQLYITPLIHLKHFSKCLIYQVYSAML